MVQKLDTIANELESAREIVLLLQARVPYVQTKAEGDAIKLLIQTQGVNTLVWAANEIFNFLGEDTRLNEADFVVTTFGNLKELTQRIDQLDVVRGWLMDPFMYDSRKELRDAALMNLRKGLMVIEGVAEYLCKPVHY